MEMTLMTLNTEEEKFADGKRKQGEGGWERGNEGVILRGRE